MTSEDIYIIEVIPTEQTRIAEVDFNDLKFGKAFADHMFIADYTDGQWQDLRIVPYGDMTISPATAGLHYGQSIFEGMKAYRLDNGEVVVFRPQANRERLNHSAHRMCMPELPEEVFMHGLTQLIALDYEWVPSTPGASLYIRPFMFATDPFVGIRPSETYRFCIFSCPVGIYYNETVKVKVEQHYSRAVKGGTGSAKAAGNYGGAYYPTKLAQEQGFHQLIWTDAKEHRYLEEAGTMNVVFIIDGKVLTPALGDTVLEGVTRNSILQIARDLGLPVEERLIEVEELKIALANGHLTDAFGLGTAATFAPMASITIGEEEYKLPPAGATSQALRKRLEDIRTGRADDTHGWLYTI